MIYFIRHGQSEANERGVFAGQKDDSLLTEKGKGEAKDTACAILEKGLIFDRIISSPLKRAQETAEIIANEICFDISKIEIEPRITEYDMGSLTGTPLSKISSQALVSSENAENVFDFKSRICFCLKELEKENKNILVVSHAGVGRILETVKLEMDPVLFYDLPSYGNATVHVIDWIK